jgi:hypothetical protein
MSRVCGRPAVIVASDVEETEEFTTSSIGKSTIWSALTVASATLPIDQVIVYINNYCV